MVSNKTDFNCCLMRSLDGYCPKPLETASSFLSKKWTISIITTIGNFGILRFNDIEQRVQGITAKILTQRLKELENEEIIRRQKYETLPPKVEYSLTTKGLQLRNALIPLMMWAEKMD